MKTLVLDQGYRPHGVVSWQRAVCMLFGGKAEVLEDYDQRIRSVSFVMPMPAVVRLVRSVRRSRRVIRFSRANVLSRDGFRCQYCNQPHPAHELTYDHVVPRSRGGRTVWENIVAACRACNLAKGNKTPVEAGMRLNKRPIRPTWLPSHPLRPPSAACVPEAWRAWVEHETRDE